MSRNVFKIEERKRKAITKWYGKIELSPGVYKRVKLFTDRKASELRLQEIQREHDQRATGILNNITDQAIRPIGLHVDEYLASLKLRVSSTDHHSIASSMLKRLAAAAEWKFIRDVTVESIERVLKSLADTESYRNCFIKRAKAFGSWLEDQGRVVAHPLRKLHRVSEKNATRTRARRAATPEESAALFALKIPEDRRLSYAMAKLNGLRRSEISRLTWDRLHLSATIPFIEVAQKNGISGEMDSIPLHPYVVKLLGLRTPGMPGVRVVRAVPDVATLEKDWTRADVDFVDQATKKRLDFHALRHTFQTDLDRAGCSRATKKRLMRHAASDVTDGYAHAELSEMLLALRRLPTPDEIVAAVAQATGTDGNKLVAALGPQLGPNHNRGAAGSDANMRLGQPPQTVISTRKNREKIGVRRSLAGSDLPKSDRGDIISQDALVSAVIADSYSLRPDTQVD